jgi:hypothetical protein
MTKRLLTILTNAAHLTLTDGEEYPSGFWAEEFAVPYQMFKKAGYTVDVATLGGVVPTVDKSSLDPNFMKWVRPSPLELAPEPGGVVVYWHVDDVAATLDRLVSLGAKQLEAPTERGPGFVTASVIDPFGNVLGIMYNRHYLDILSNRGGA